MQAGSWELQELLELLLSTGASRLPALWELGAPRLPVVVGELSELLELLLPRGASQLLALLRELWELPVLLSMGELHCDPELHQYFHEHQQWSPLHLARSSQTFCNNYTEKASKCLKLPGEAKTSIFGRLWIGVLESGGVLPQFSKEGWDPYDVIQGWGLTLT